MIQERTFQPENNHNDNMMNPSDLLREFRKNSVTIITSRQERSEDDEDAG